MQILPSKQRVWWQPGEEEPSGEIKNTLEGTKSRITEAEDRIIEVKDRMEEISEAERKKEKRI